MNKLHQNSKLLALGLALLAGTAEIQATPYATSLTNNGVTLSFRLNESADSVRVTYTNLSGALLTTNLGTKLAGLTTTNLNIPGTYSILVAKTNLPGWINGSTLQISNDTTNTVKFTNPRGVAVNTDPTSSYFGRIYVANAAAGTSLSRTVTDGIYLMNADFSDAVGQGNTARDAGLTTFTNLDDVIGSPWRLEVGQDNNLYISDFTQTNGTIYVTDPNVTTGTNIIGGLGISGISPTASPNHGRITSSVIALGSTNAGNLTLYALNTDVTNAPTLTANHIMQWNLGSGPYGQDLVVTNMDNDSLLPNSGITSDLDRGPDGKFYLLQNRSDGFEGGIMVVDPASDGLSPFNPSADNLWDKVYDSRSDSVGYYGQAVDLLRLARAVKISPDGQYMAVIRDDNQVWIIPLVGGIPNLAARKLMANGSTTPIGRDISFDAAGNIYVASSGQALMRVFSPGYKTVATTSSTGTFSVQNFLPDANVEIIGTSTNASEPNVNGEVVFTRTGSTASPLTVFFTLSGTAARNVDYTNANGAISPLTGTNGSITFLAGIASTNVDVTVLNDFIGEAVETVGFNLSANTNYVGGTNTSAIVFIADDGDLPAVSVTSRGLGSYELIPYRPAKFNVSIPAIFGSDVTVQCSLTGTAVSGVDYVNPATFSVTIPQGLTSVITTVTPIDNSTVSSNKTIILNVLVDPSYTNVGFISATNILRNDDLAPTTTLFAEDFDADHTANWVVKTNVNDAFIDFFFDYSTVGVPVAPHTVGGTTKGLKMKAHLALASTLVGISTSPKNQSFTGDYRLRFDMWYNFAGPLDSTGTGSTELLFAGVGASETKTNGPFGLSPGPAVYFAVAPDAGFSAGSTGSRDFGAYTNLTALDPSLASVNVWPAGTGTTARDNANSYYAEFGDLTAPPAQLALFSNQTRTNVSGGMGMCWHDVIITKTSTNVTWTIDGLLISTVITTNINSLMSTNIFFAYDDPNTGSIANANGGQDALIQFGLIDNVRVETLGIQNPVITAVAIINSGADVQIDFTGAAADPASAFTLQSSTDVQGTYADVSASITSTGSGTFRAVRAVAGAQQFYRIKR